MSWIINKQHDEPTNEEMGFKPMSKRSALALWVVVGVIIWAAAVSPWWLW